MTGPHCKGDGGPAAGGANTCIGLLFCCSCTAGGTAGVCGGDEMTSCASARQMGIKKPSATAPHRRNNNDIPPAPRSKDFRSGMFTVANRRMLLQRWPQGARHLFGRQWLDFANGSSRAASSKTRDVAQWAPAMANFADGAAVCHRARVFSSASSTGRILTPRERSFEVSRTQLERGAFAWQR